MNWKTGTLIRCADVTESRIAFYRKIGLETLQIAGVYRQWLEGVEGRKNSDALFALFDQYDLRPESMFLSFPNQDWSDSGKRIGLVPEITRAERMVCACRQMNWAARYGIRMILCHVGHIMEERNEQYFIFLNDMRELIRFAGENGQEFLFETGQESVRLMKQVFEEIGEKNLGINFDPANLLIYNHDSPELLLDEMISFVKGVHCKDAVRPVGEAASGRETVLGEGDTDFPNLFARLAKFGFSGPLVIERELPFGPEQERDVANAVIYLNNLKKNHKR